MTTQSENENLKSRLDATLTEAAMAITDENRARADEMLTKAALLSQKLDEQTVRGRNERREGITRNVFDSLPQAERLRRLREGAIVHG